jgi:hypothetical protein
MSLDLDVPKRKRSVRKRSDRKTGEFDAALADARYRIRMDDDVDFAWKGGARGDVSVAAAKPEALVGAHAHFYLLVYGVLPVDLQERGAFVRARALARACVDRFVEHGLGIDDAYECLAWAWRREQGRRTWALQTGKAWSPMGPAAAFSARTMGDWMAYRAAKS